MLLDVFLEEQAQNVALLMTVLILYVVLVGKRLRLFRGLDRMKVNARVFFFTASTMVMRSNGFPKSISTPL